MAYRAGWCRRAGSDSERSSATWYSSHASSAYGTDWYGYFMRRLAEKPANLLFFARSVLTKG